MHKAGFVNIIGNPNVGKSTLMNALVGERLSIITSKAQTTRHRILGVVSGEDFQIVFSDTPGILKPSYKLQESMMKFVTGAVNDADVILYVTDTVEQSDDSHGVPRTPPTVFPSQQPSIFFRISSWCCIKNPFEIGRSASCFFLRFGRLIPSFEL